MGWDVGTGATPPAAPPPARSGAGHPALSGLEVVVNVSEGRDDAVLADLAAAAAPALLDVHRDRHHHRAVFTVASRDGAEVEAAAAALARTAAERVDLAAHQGVHPRIGVVDVVPFVPLVGLSPVDPGGNLGDAVAARDRFAAWCADELGIPCFLYGPERSLPDVRRGAFTTVAPSAGPVTPHPRAGACAVGARGALIAYNLWLDDADVATARSVATALRGPAVRTLGLAVGGAAQVACNLIDPRRVGPAEVYDLVAAHAAAAGTGIARAELVGLAPLDVVTAIDRRRWAALDLDPDRTVEARLARRGR